MFEILKYKIATRGYFNPELKTNVSRDEFLQILKGKVVNPNALHFSTRGKDYQFMVVGVTDKGFPSSWAGKKWGSRGYEDAHECAKWYAKFSCEGDSRVVFPSRNLYFNLEAHPRFAQRKEYLSASDLKWVMFEGNLDKKVDADLKVAVSVLDEGEVFNYMINYQRLFFK